LWKAKVSVEVAEGLAGLLVSTGALASSRNVRVAEPIGVPAALAALTVNVQVPLAVAG